MAAYGGPQRHPGQQGYYQQPARKGGCGTCAVVGLVLAGLAFIGMAIIVVAAIVVYRSSSGRDEVAEKSELEQLKEQIDSDREQRQIEEMTPPTTIDEAINGLSSASEVKREVSARWLGGQPANARDKRRVSAALVGAMTRTTSEEVKVESMNALRNWGDGDIGDEIAEVVKASRLQDEVVQVGLVLLTKYRSDKGIEALVLFLNSNEHGALAANQLAEFGPGVHEKVLSLVDVTDEVAMTNARSLFRQLNQDVDEQLLDLFLSRLQGADQETASKIAGELAEIRVDEARREEVAAALNPSIDRANPHMEKVLKALSKWGTETNAERLVVLSGSRKYRDNEDLVRLLIRFKDPRAADILVEAMNKDDNLGRLAADALESMGEAAIKEVLPHYNDPNERVRSRARRVLAGAGATEEQIFDQCIRDLESADEARQISTATELAETEVYPDKQADVAKALVVLARDDDTWSKKRAPAMKALEAWATEDVAEDMMTLLDHRDEKVWHSAFKVLVKMSPTMKESSQLRLAQRTGELLGDFFRQREVPRLMKESGESAEWLAIAMLSHTEKDVVKRMCELLTDIGGEASIEPLDKIAEYAARHDARDVALSANIAKRAAQARAAERRKEREDKDDEEGDESK